VVGRHFAIGRLDIGRHNVRARQFLDKLTDAAFAYSSVKSFVHGFTHSDGEFPIRKVPIRMVHV
jgi:hypothetical protein